MGRRLAYLLAGALIVSACGGDGTVTPGPSPSATPVPTDIFSQTPVPSEAASLAPDGSVEPTTSAGETTYTVVKGDTMIKIAKQFGVTVAALKAANPTVEPTKMRIGSVLIIPPK